MVTSQLWSLAPSFHPWHRVFRDPGPTAVPDVSAALGSTCLCACVSNELTSHCWWQWFHHACKCMALKLRFMTTIKSGRFDLACILRVCSIFLSKLTPPTQLEWTSLKLPHQVLSSYIIMHLKAWIHHEIVRCFIPQPLLGVEHIDSFSCHFHIFFWNFMSMWNCASGTLMHTH